MLSHFSKNIERRKNNPIQFRRTWYVKWFLFSTGVVMAVSTGYSTLMPLSTVISPVSLHDFVVLSQWSSSLMWKQMTLLKASYWRGKIWYHCLGYVVFCITEYALVGAQCSLTPFSSTNTIRFPETLLFISFLLMFQSAWLYSFCSSFSLSLPTVSHLQEWVELRVSSVRPSPSDIPRRRRQISAVRDGLNEYGLYLKQSLLNQPNCPCSRDLGLSSIVRRPSLNLLCFPSYIIIL